MKFKKYPKYKDSGIEWIGEIPEDWEKIPLRYVLEQGKTGIKIGPFGSALKLDSMVESGYKVYGQENVIKSNFDLGLRFIDETKFTEMIGYELLEGDVIVTMMGTTGLSKVVPKNAKKGIMDSHLVRIRVNKEICDNNFLSFLINSGNYLKIQMKLASKGSIMEGLNSSILKSILLFLPKEVEEQKQIREFLQKQIGKIDSDIEKNQKLIELLKEKRQSTINQAVTKGLDPTVPMKDSGIEWIGEIPEHWKIERVKFHTKINHKTLDENTEPESMIHYIDISSVNSNGNISSPEQMNFNDAPSRARRILTEGDCIVSTVRTYLRAIAYISSVTNKLICSTGFAVLSPNSNLDSKFLFYQIRNEGFIENIMANSVGVTYPAINSSLLGTFPVIIVPKIEQKQIAEFLDKETTKIDSLITKTESQIEKLEEFRQSLITSAVTGKIDVRGIAA